MLHREVPHLLRLVVATVFPFGSVSFDTPEHIQWGVVEYVLSPGEQQAGCPDAVYSERVELPCRPYTVYGVLQNHAGGLPLRDSDEKPKCGAANGFVELLSGEEEV